MPTNSEFIDKAREYVGTPFVHQGRSRYGLDCVGLIIRVILDFELFEIQEEAYSKQPDGRMQERLRNYLLWKPASEPLEIADVILFRLPFYACHVAIYAGNGKIIHALSGNQKVVEHGIDEKWTRRIVETYKIPGVE